MQSSRRRRMIWKKKSDELDTAKTKLGDERKKAAERVKKAAAEVKDVQAQQVKMARDLAGKALEHPKVVVE